MQRPHEPDTHGVQTPVVLLTPVAVAPHGIKGQGEPQKYCDSEQGNNLLHVLKESLKACELSHRVPNVY